MKNSELSTIRGMGLPWITSFSVAVMLLVAAAPCAGYQATITRDRYGVPHIAADTLADAAFGDGYVQAEDRLEQVMANIQEATGTRAAVLGLGSLNADIKSRLTGARRAALQAWETPGAISAEVRQVVEAFAAGVNYYMTEHHDSLPSNARPLEPYEVVALSQYATTARQFQQAVLDKTGGEDEDLSNEWVLGPTRTKKGKIILQVDPHLPWSGINRFYEKHYIIPDLNIYGANITGAPLFIFATNGRIAWALTRNASDRGDCFSLTPNPSNPQQEYLLDSVPTPYQQIVEEIQVAGEPSPRTVVLLRSVHGPVFASSQQNVFAAGMSTLDRAGVMEEVYRMNTAQDVFEFRDAIALMEMDGFQAVAGDSSGNIFYGWVNRVNERNDAFDWRRCVDGSTSASLYLGTRPFSALPQALNPEEGYFQASNTPNWEVGDGAWGISRADFPSWMLESPVRQFLPSRAQRLVDLIEGRPKHSLRQSRRYSTDTLVLEAQWLIPVIERAVAELGDGGDPNVARALAELSRWQRKPEAQRRSRAFTIWHELIALFWDPSLPSSHDIRETYDLPAHPEQVTDADLQLMHDGFLQAVESLVTVYGTVRVPWGDVNAIELADGTRFPFGGGCGETQTLWQGSHKSAPRGEDGVWIPNAGSGFMMSVELSDLPRIYTLVPHGESDDPSSPFFANRTGDYVRGRYRHAAYTSRQVARRAISTTTVTTP